MTLEDIIDDIKTSTAPQPMRTKIIAIDGPGGAGKTVLAKRIGLALNAQVIHTDDFFDPIVRDNWSKRLLSQVLEPLSKNQSGRYQPYDWDTSLLTEWRDVAPDYYLVIEGVQASRKELRKYIAFNIWVETPRKIRLQRGLARDGHDAKDKWVEWMKREDAYIIDEHPDRSADLTVDGTDSETFE